MCFYFMKNVPFAKNKKKYDYSKIKETTWTGENNSYKKKYVSYTAKKLHFNKTK